MYYLQSRYYDPEVCRFINADAFVSTGQGIIGYNMFAYCGNNPVNCSDGSGNWPKWLDGLEDEIRSFVSDARDFLIEQKQESEKNTGAYGLGITESAGFGGGLSLSFGLVLDNRGNVGIDVSYSFGASTPSAFVGPYVLFTNASSIYTLGGDFGSTLINGASVGEIIGGGADFLIIQDPQKPSGFSTGIVIQGGLTAKIPVPFEVHTHTSGGDVIGFNIYDSLISVCNWLLGG